MPLHRNMSWNPSPLTSVRRALEAVEEAGEKCEMDVENSPNYCPENEQNIQLNTTVNQPLPPPPRLTPHTASTEERSNIHRGQGRVRLVVGRRGRISSTSISTSWGRVSRRIGRGRGRRGGRGDRLGLRELTVDQIAEVSQNCNLPLPLRAAALDESRLPKTPQQRVEERNVCVDAESFIVNELFDGDISALEFQWSPMATFSGQAEEFQPPNQTGPIQNASSSYEAFRKYWDDGILEHIVQETNRYAAEIASSSAQFASAWYDTNVHEVLLLFAFWMMLSVIQMPTIKSCYTDMHLLKIDIFRTIFTEARYRILNRALHFVDNATRRPDSSKLFCLGPIVNHLKAKFQECYIPDQNMTINESLTLWKGDLLLQEEMFYGLKTYELCESSTGYMWSFFIDTAKDGNGCQGYPKSLEMVADLVRPLLNRGHRLFLDSSLNSPVLARFLKRNKTDCVGKIAKKYVLDHIHNFSKLSAKRTAFHKTGFCMARHCGDVVILAYQGENMISTYHNTDAERIESTPDMPAQYKLSVVTDYKLFKGGNDKVDLKLEPYLNEKNKKWLWYKKLFKHILNASINNSRILINRSWALDPPPPHYYFRLDLVNKILSNHLALAPNDPNSDLPHERLIAGNHFPARLDDQPRTEGTDRRQPIQRQCCLWCSVRKGKRSLTKSKCNVCNVPLCDTCFEMYHTVR